VSYHTRTPVHRKGQARGESHGSAILTEAEVREIRYRITPWSRTSGFRALADEYGVTEWAIKDVVYRVTWVHVL
jgi:hypothetical protein